MDTNAAELHRKDGVPKVKQSLSKAVLDENGLAKGSQVVTQAVPGSTFSQ